MISLLILFYILFPILVLYLCYKFSFFNKLGAVIICYIVGIALGNLEILPPDILKYQEIIKYGSKPNNF